MKWLHIAWLVMLSRSLSITGNCEYIVVDNHQILFSIAFKDVGAKLLP